MSLRSPWQFLQWWSFVLALESTVWLTFHSFPSSLLLQQVLLLEDGKTFIPPFLSYRTGRSRTSARLFARNNELARGDDCCHHFWFSSPVGPQVTVWYYLLRTSLESECSYRRTQFGCRARDWMYAFLSHRATLWRDLTWFAFEGRRCPNRRNWMELRDLSGVATRVITRWWRDQAWNQLHLRVRKLHQ